MVESRLSTLTRLGKVAIVSYDPGGAEILSSWLREDAREYRAVVRGPARPIFSSKIVQLQEAELSEAIEFCDWVLTGSSWSSTLEIEAIQIAHDNKKHVVTFLDHWVNYRDRLVRDEILTLPNEVWVGDNYAYQKAKSELPDVRCIRVVSNPYFERAVAQTKCPVRLHGPERPRILYVCENISQHALSTHSDPYYWGYTEYDALRYFLTKLGDIKNLDTPIITIRPHPSDQNGKYNAIASEFHQWELVISSGESLGSQIASHDWVVGCNTTAMVIGLFSGRRVISCIPPNGRECVLPHDGIEKWM